VTWTYDHRGNVSTVVTAGSNVSTQYAYGRSGALATKTGVPPSQAQPPQQHTYSYDSRGRLQTDTLAVQGWHLDRTYSYTADSDVHTLVIDDAVADGTLHTTMTFGYDGLHRLTAADTSTGVAYHAQLTYHPNGSIDLATVTGQLVGLPPRSNVAYGYDVTGLAADVQSVTALTASDGVTLAQFLYDRSGNMTARQHTMEAAYLYDAHDQLRQVESPSGSGTWERYYYDHNRRRFLALASDGSWRFYIGDAYEMDHHADGTSRQNSYVIANGEAVMRVAACGGMGCQSAVPAVTFLHHDRRGDLLASFDLNGTVQSHFAYGAFGEVLSKYEAALAEWRRRFNGKEQDQIDDLSYYGYRYFDPLTLQWTSTDPLLRFGPEVAQEVPQRLNLYSFSLNNSHRYSDPNGLFPFESHLGGPPPSQFGPNCWEACGYDPTAVETATTAGAREGYLLGLKGRYRTIYAQAYWNLDPHYKSSAQSMTDSPVPALNQRAGTIMVLRALQTLEEWLRGGLQAVNRWNASDQAQAVAWFGSTSPAVQTILQSRIMSALAAVQGMTLSNFVQASGAPAGTYAQVSPSDLTHQVQLAPLFTRAPEVGFDSKAGTLAHEISHFLDVGSTLDVVYGVIAARALAISSPAAAITNADSFEYYLESR
jgi:RHS repeat-associated protein